MNRITGAAMMMVAIFGAGKASANDGILSCNMSDPYFTTPTEFVELAKRKKRGSGSRARGSERTDDSSGGAE